MKSLVRSAKTRSAADKATQKANAASSSRTAQAQCCAKVSRTVAGCHD